MVLMLSDALGYMFFMFIPRNETENLLFILLRPNMVKDIGLGVLNDHANAWEVLEFWN